MKVKCFDCGRSINIHAGDRCYEELLTDDYNPICEICFVSHVNNGLDVELFADFEHGTDIRSVVFWDGYSLAEVNETRDMDTPTLFADIISNYEFTPNGQIIRW